MINKHTIANFVQELQVAIIVTVISSQICVLVKQGLIWVSIMICMLILTFFLYNTCEILGGWTSDSNWCSFHENFGFAADLLRAFCSVFVRVYLNLTVSCFEDILSKVAVIDKNKILTQTLKHAEIF